MINNQLLACTVLQVREAGCDQSPVCARALSSLGNEHVALPCPQYWIPTQKWTNPIPTRISKGYAFDIRSRKALENWPRFASQPQLPGFSGDVVRCGAHSWCTAPPEIKTQQAPILEITKFREFGTPYFSSNTHSYCSSSVQVLNHPPKIRIFMAFIAIDA